MSSTTKATNNGIPIVALAHLNSEEFIVEPDLEAESLSAKTVHVVLDEAFDPFSAVCAVVLTEDEYDSANREISTLRGELGQSGYLAGLDSSKKFLDHGFHATDDTTEVSTRFIDEMFKRLPGKAFIYYTDGQRRRDLSPKKTVLLMYACLIQVILLNHKRARRVILHFEHHEELERYYPRLAELATRRTRTSAAVITEACPKGEPDALALADYVLHIFGHSVAYVVYGHEPSAEYQFRNLLAIKNHVSLIYSMEWGRMASRQDH